MAISIDWKTKVITVPQADLTFVSVDLYELDVDAFRLTLKNLEDDEEGIVFIRTHNHNTEIIIAGVTYARSVELINGYTVTFENGLYRVRLAGANNNIADVLNLNSVSVLSQNSAGLIVAGGAGIDPWLTALPGAYAVGQAGNILGNRLDADVSTRAVPGDAMTLTAAERDAVANALLDLADSIETGLNARESLRLMSAALAGKISGAETTTVAIRNAVQDTKTRISATVDSSGNRTAIAYDVT